MPVRVTRLIEYTYADAEAMAEDMARWTHSHNWGKTVMRSATLTPAWVEDEAPDEDPPAGEGGQLMRFEVGNGNAREMLQARNAELAIEGYLALHPEEYHNTLTAKPIKGDE